MFKLIFILPFCCCNFSNAQSYFEVKTKKEVKTTYYKLSLVKKESQDDEIAYPIFWINSVHYPNIDTIKIIEELLSYEGDERLCSIPIMSYSQSNR